MHRLGAVGLLAAGLLTCPFVCAGVQTSHFPAENHETLKVDGTVYYGANDEPAANVMVELTDAQGDAIAPEMTNEAGQFRFGGLNAGQYAISIRADGYQPVNYPVDLSYNSERGVSIYLKAIPPSRDDGPGSAVSAHELTMPPHARELMESGKKKLYGDKDAKSGLSDFERAAQEAPGYYEPYFQMGMAYMTLGNPSGAEKSFRKAIAMSGDKYAEAEVGLGALYLDKKNYAAGEKAVRHGIELSPTYWLGYYELGRAELDENKLNDAETSAEEAKALAPTAMIVYRLLSNIHLREKKYPALLEDLDAYIQLDPKSLMGVHAQQLRMQVAAEIHKQKTGNTADTKP